MTTDEIERAASFDKLFAERFPSFKANPIRLSEPICFGDQMVAGEFMSKVMGQMLEHARDVQVIRTAIQRARSNTKFVRELDEFQQTMDRLEQELGI